MSRTIVDSQIHLWERSDSRTAMPRTIIDSQIHLWERESPDRPWPDYGRAYAHGEELTAEQALARMDEAGLHRAVLVPPSWEGDRNDVCLAAAQDYPDRFAVMGRFAIEDPAQGDALADWRETPGMLGVRLTFRNEVQKPWLTDGTADWFWREAERVGIPTMVFVPGSLPAVAVIAQRHPDLKLVIDRLSLFGVLDGAIFEQLPQVLDLARFPNFAVKARSRTGRRWSTDGSRRSAHRDLPDRRQACGSRRRLARN